MVALLQTVQKSLENLVQWESTPHNTVMLHTIELVCMCLKLNDMLYLI